MRNIFFIAQTDKKRECSSTFVVIISSTTFHIPSSLYRWCVNLEKKEAGDEQEKSERILPEFSSPAFRLNSFSFSFSFF